VRALALPAESPTNVLDLARDPRFGGAHLLIIIGTGHGDHTAYPWPAALEGPDPTAACFRELDLGPHPSSGADPLADVRAFEIVCP
jgi:hypothetical protein